MYDNSIDRLRSALVRGNLPFTMPARSAHRTDSPSKSGEQAKAIDSGTPVFFTPTRGSKRQGVVVFDFDAKNANPETLLVHLTGDPYPVYLSKKQLRKVDDMPTDTDTDEVESAAPARPKRSKAAAAKSTATKSKARTKAAAEPAEEAPKPRKAAASKKAAKPAAAAKKAPATKRTTTAKTEDSIKPIKASEVAEDNPFRPQSNSHIYTEVLKQGGKRSALVKRIINKVNVHPWAADEEYESQETEVDKRMGMVAKTLENKHGWTILRSGRGMEGSIQAVPPAKKVRSKKSTAA